ncbi:MAG TPA: hypothetical protein VLG44_02670 [Chlamydiales bacterium]|nr:hypothetical protein [Chlamydiales bacterium]
MSTPPVQKQSRYSQEPLSSPIPPKRRGVVGPDREEEKGAGPSLPPPIVNTQALALSRTSAKPVPVQVLDIPTLYIQIDQGFADDPEIEPEALGEQLSLIPELLPSFTSMSYSKIKSDFGSYMDQMEVDPGTKRVYLKVVSEICRQSTLNSSSKESALDFCRNAEKYLNSVRYSVFQEAIREGRAILARRESISSVAQVLSKFDELRRISSLGEGRNGQLIGNLISDSFPASKLQFRNFCQEVKRRKADSPLDELSERLRNQMKSFLGSQRSSASSSSSQGSSLFDIEADAIWKAGYLVLRTAIQNSRGPSLSSPSQELTEQCVAETWDKFSSELIDQRELIHRFLNSLLPEDLQKIREDLLALHVEGGLDKRANLLFKAFTRSLSQPLTLALLKQWCLRPSL